MRQIKNCPNCNATYGWFEKRVHYGNQYYEEDGQASHFDEGNTTGGKRKFCAQCSKDITSLIADD